MKNAERGHMTALAAGLLGCPECRLLCRSTSGASSSQPLCPRCEVPLHPRKPDSLARTWALVITAAIFYIPANVLPVMYTTYLGRTSANTIISGVYYFMQSGSWYLALIIFIASVIIPAFKLLVLCLLLISLQRRYVGHPELRTRLYRLIEFIGRWSMVDIFVVTVMAALLRSGGLASVQAGWGALFFGAVVVITMIAANTFDPRLIWDALE